MITISNAAGLARAMTLLPDGVRDLLLLRREQLGEFAGSARFVVVQPRDTPSLLEETLGWSVFQNAGDGTWYGDPDYSQGCDLCVDYGFAYEITFEFTSDFTHVILVEKAPGVHRDFLEFCARYASQHA